HLVGEEAVLREAQGVHFAAAAVVLRAAVVGVRVGEDDVQAARANAAAGAGALAPVVVPAAHVLDGVGVLVAVVLEGGGGAIGRAVAILVERGREVVPVLAQAFVPRVLHGPQRAASALVDVQHLAAVLGHGAVEHLAAAHGAAAEGIVAVAYGLHLGHVLLADALVAGLVHDDAGVVAVVDDGVAHQLQALGPGAALRVALGIARRHHLHQAHAVDSERDAQGRAW